MKKKEMLSIVGLAVVLSLAVFSSAAYACWPWLNVLNYAVHNGREEGQKILFNIGLGHSFPFGHSFISYGKTGHTSADKIYMLSPDGAKLKVKPRVYSDGTVSQIEFETVDKLKPGTHLLVLQTKAKRGKARPPQKGSTFKQMWAKAIVNVGESRGNAFKKVLGHGLEIIPLKDPADLRVHDYIPVKVLLNGNGIRAFLYARHMGSSPDRDVFSQSLKIPKKDGIGKIQITHPGIWFIRIEHIYSDPKIADHIQYRATLTFEVR